MARPRFVDTSGEGKDCGGAAAVQAWARAWLECGAAECRFQKPVYDGDIATATATETADGLDLRVDSHGELCATGSASLPNDVASPSELFAEPPLPPDQRPPA